jgi:hypothetical protein
MFAEGLHTYTQDLTAIHLGAALGCLYQARQGAAQPDKPLGSDGVPMRLIRVRQLAISSIMHCYSGLESAINSAGYRLFSDQESPRYITERDLPLKRFIEAWNKTLPLVDKFCFLLENSGKDVPRELAQPVRELASLRNWIVHGFNYKTTILCQESPDRQALLVIDREDSCNWSEKFSQTRFKSLDMLDSDDADKANRIVVQALVALADAIGEMYCAWSWWGDTSFLTFVARPGVGTNIGELFGRADSWPAYIPRGS